MDEEVLRRSLECPICLVIPRKVKIFSCQNGHTICEPCLTALPPPQNCPKGSCSYYNPGCRMLVLEGMIERTTMEVGCIMAREGCPVTMVQGKLLDEHESKCRLRKVKCICSPCPSEVSIENLLEHVTTRTPSMGVLSKVKEMGPRTTGSGRLRESGGISSGMTPTEGGPPSSHTQTLSNYPELFCPK